MKHINFHELNKNVIFYPRFIKEDKKTCNCKKLKAFDITYVYAEKKSKKSERLVTFSVITCSTKE